MANKFKTFVAGDVLTAAQVNDNLMKQVVIETDSSADYPASPKEGMVVYDKALDAFLSYTGSAWVRIIPLTNTAVENWTPSITQSGAVTVTVNEAKYVRQGAFVDAWANLSITGSGTANNNVLTSLPVTSTMTSNHVIGNGFIFDTSGADTFAVTVTLQSTTTAGFQTVDTTAASTGSWGVAPNVALASGDSLRFRIRYLVG